MRRESREVWRKRVERWRDSGLTAQEFASEIGVNVHSLRSWSWRLAAERQRAERPDAPPVAQPLAFVEVTAPAKEPATQPAQSSPFEIVFASGVTVRVPAHFQVDQLRRLLA